MVSAWCNVYTCRGRLEYSYEGVWSLHGVMYIHAEGGWSIPMRGCGLCMHGVMYIHAEGGWSIPMRGCGLCMHGVMYIHAEGGWSIALYMRGCGLYMMLITVKSLSPSLPLSLSARLFTVAVEVKDTQSKLSIATTSN